MGIPPDTEYGDDCGVCFPADKTPLFMIAYFFDVLDCDPLFPPGHGSIPTVMHLEQDPGVPCRWWGGDINKWHATYFASVGGKSVLVLMYGNITYFLHEINALCQTDFINQAACDWVLQYGHGGTGLVTPFPDPDIAATADLINFDFSGESRAEFERPESDRSWAMLANIEESTRIYIGMEE